MAKATFFCLAAVFIAVKSFEGCPKQEFLEHINFKCYNYKKPNVYYSSPPAEAKTKTKVDLEQAHFEKWLRTLRQNYLDIFPIDPVQSNAVRQVKASLFSIVKPSPFSSEVQLVAVSDSALSECLDIKPTVRKSGLFIDFISGNNRSGLFQPYLAHRYGGHQFGFWAGQLGDGRAVLLGERVSRQGQRWELQLKGSGLTPYSRAGDGRAVLRSSTREFLASEAMHHLGIPTSRAVSLVVSNDHVIRDQFYDGHPRPERTAIVLRLASSWFRIGSLEILARLAEIKLLRLLLDYVITTHYKTIDITDDDRYLRFFQEVVTGTSKMISKWQSVGFAHGVCNTDNFSLLSITIDYGPFGFLDAYNPKYVPNTSDNEGRYSYENQPDVGYFNLDKLRAALDPVFSKKQRRAAHIILKGYVDEYKTNFLQFFAKKLGFTSVESEDENMIAILLKIMKESEADFTMTFRQMGEIPFSDLIQNKVSEEFWALRVIQGHNWFQTFLKLYNNRMKAAKINDKHRRSIMNRNNPAYVLRNWMAEKAIVAVERGTFQEIEKLQQILQQPFVRQREAEELGYASKPPNWSSQIRVSCSS